MWEVREVEMTKDQIDAEPKQQTDRKEAQLSL